MSSLSQRFKLFVPNFPFSRVNSWISTFPLSRVVSSLSQRFKLFVRNIPFSRVNAWISTFPFSRVTQFLLQGCQGPLLVEEGFHSQPQAVISSSSKLTPPPVVLVWCFDWVNFNPFFKGILQNVCTVVEQGHHLLTDTDSTLASVSCSLVGADELQVLEELILLQGRSDFFFPFFATKAADHRLKTCFLKQENGRKAARWNCAHQKEHIVKIHHNFTLFQGFLTGRSNFFSLFQG